MEVLLIDYTVDPERKIGLYASICYDSNTSDNACIRRAAACVNKGHLATLRFAYATFKIQGISRACSHQLVRSKHLDYLQESQRYVEQLKIDYIKPTTLTEEQYKLFVDQYKEAERVYHQLLNSGMKKEDARYVLPNAATTSLYVTGNFQAWLDFIKLRSGPEVQWEIREVAHEIQTQLKGIAPNVF